MAHVDSRQELGAITGIFESDIEVRRYVNGRKVRLYKSDSVYFAADMNAPYAAWFTVDLGDVEPYIAICPNKDNIQPIYNELGMKFDGIFIGACTTTEEDLVLAGLILQVGLSRGLFTSSGKACRGAWQPSYREQPEKTWLAGWFCTMWLRAACAVL